jgi:hypothetical protein
MVLLTATPVNNSLLDLYFQIRLFASDAAFQDLGASHLGELFRLAALAPEQSPPAALTRVLNEIVIRRSRPEDPEETGGKGVRFPRRSPPVAVRYSLDEAYPGFLDAALQTVESLTLSPYQNDARAAGVPELIKLVMLKRLESSSAAFAASITALLRFHEAFLRAAKERRLLRAVDHRALCGADGLQLWLDALVLGPLRSDGRGASIIEAATDDLEHLQRLSARLASLSAADPKVATLVQLLNGPLHNRKVLVFTEFRETARVLWRALLPHGGVGLVDGERALLGGSRASRLEVVRRFAPESNRAHSPPPHEAVRVLVSTDVLSEGLNLQDADTVISFDLPWNPVRLIQRVGRIDRMGSKHNCIECYNFLPDQGLEAALGLLSRLRQKLAAIHRGLGGEATVLGEGTLIGGMVERLASGDPGLFDDLERAAAHQPATRQLRQLYKQRRSDSGDPSRIAAGAVPVAAVALPDSAIGQSVFVCEGNGSIRAWHISGEGVSELEDETFAGLLERALLLEDVSQPTNTVDLQRLEQILFEHLDRERSNRELPRGSTAGVAARRLLQAVSTHPEFADAATCTAVDRVIGRLALGLRAGEENAVREWLACSHAAPEHPAQLCVQLMAILTDPPASVGPHSLRVLAVFQAA